MLILTVHQFAIRNFSITVEPILTRLIVSERMTQVLYFTLCKLLDIIILDFNNGEEIGVTATMPTTLGSYGT